MTPDPLDEVAAKAATHTSSYLDSVLVAGGTLASIFTSEKTVIALTVVFTLLRIIVYVRDLWRREE
jgi:hypothetical protein